MRPLKESSARDVFVQTTISADSIWLKVYKNTTLELMAFFLPRKTNHIILMQYTQCNEPTNDIQVVLNYSYHVPFRRLFACIKPKRAENTSHDEDFQFEDRDKVIWFLLSFPVCRILQVFNTLFLAKRDEKLLSSLTHCVPQIKHEIHRESKILFSEWGA